MGKKQQYFIGIGIGCIPVVLFMIGLPLNNTAGGALVPIGLACYLLELILAVIFLVSQRYLAYGLFTMLVASPVIAFIGCIVLNVRL